MLKKVLLLFLTKPRFFTKPTWLPTTLILLVQPPLSGSACLPTTAEPAEHFLAKLKNTAIQPDEIMVSFDATPLFASIPKELAETIVRESLSQLQDSSNTELKNEHLLGILKLCMQTFFTFPGQPYEQIKGTPMGSPISGYIAEIVLQKLEAAAFETQKPSFWVCYVGDTFAIIKSSRQADFKTHLNSIFTDIQFTMEEEKDGTLPFLDVLVR